MPLMPQTGGGGDAAGLMQLLMSQDPMTYQQPNQIARELSNPVPQDPYAADRAFAAGNAFNPNWDTNGEGFLPMGDIGGEVGAELGGGVEQQVAQSLVQSAMAGQINLNALLSAIAQYTTVGEAAGSADPFMQQYQDAMPAAWGSQELTDQRLSYPWLDPTMYPTNTPQPGGMLY